LATATFAAIRSEDREGFEAPAADFIFKVIVWVVVFLFTTVVSLCAALVFFKSFSELQAYSSKLLLSGSMLVPE